jgi:hypothetical protein
VTGVEFVRGFLQHVLPKGFLKVRHYGWMVSHSRTARDHVKWLVWLFLGRLRTRQRLFRFRIIEMRDALINKAVWIRTRLKPCTLKVRAVRHSSVQSTFSSPRMRSSFGPQHRQNSMTMRYQGTSPSEMGQLKDAFDKQMLDPKNAFPIAMAPREIAFILNDTPRP